MMMHIYLKFKIIEITLKVANNQPLQGLSLTLVQQAGSVKGSVFCLFKYLVCESTIDQWL